MSIEFSCSRCQRLLSTPDDSAGKQARCPECGASVRIPTIDELAHPGWAETAAYVGDWQNATASAAERVTSAAVPQHPLVATQIELGDLLGRSWEIFKQCWGRSLAGTWASMALVGTVIGLSCLPLLVRGNDDPHLADFALFGGAALAVWWLHLGLCSFTLKLARGEPTTWADLFDVGDVFASSLVMCLVGLSAVALGFACCFVPGILLLLMFSQAPFVLLDRRTGPIEALGISAQIMAGNKVTLFLTGLLLWAIAGTASVVTLGLSGIVANPFWFLTMAVAYVMMSGGNTAYVPARAVEPPLPAPGAPAPAAGG
jgi:hypothetical protein